MYIYFIFYYTSKIPKYYLVVVVYFLNKAMFSFYDYIIFYFLKYISLDNIFILLFSLWNILTIYGCYQYFKIFIKHGFVNRFFTLLLIIFSWIFIPNLFIRNILMTYFNHHDILYVFRYNFLSRFYF